MQVISLNVVLILAATANAATAESNSVEVTVLKLLTINGNVAAQIFMVRQQCSTNNNTDIAFTLASQNNTLQFMN